MLYMATPSKPAPHPNDPTQLLSFQDVTRKTQLGETKLRKMVHKGEFPAPRNIAGKIYFLQEQVDEWIRGQFASE